jgi:hypothetical protein
VYRCRLPRRAALARAAMPCVAWPPPVPAMAYSRCVTI